MVTFERLTCYHSHVSCYAGMNTEIAEHDLQPSTSYTFWVAPRVAEEVGPWSHVSFTTLDAREYATYCMNQFALPLKSYNSMGSTLL